eukprot:332691-Prymnesium_polylepis.1
MPRAPLHDRYARTSGPPLGFSWKSGEQHPPRAHRRPPSTAPPGSAAPPFRTPPDLPPPTRRLLACTHAPPERRRTAPTQAASQVCPWLRGAAEGFNPQFNP